MITKQQIWLTMFTNAIINNDPRTAMKHASHIADAFVWCFGDQIETMQQQVWLTVAANSIINNDPSTATKHAGAAADHFICNFDNQTLEKEAENKRTNRMSSMTYMRFDQS